MKTKTKKFDSVSYFRKIKEIIGQELLNKSFEEQREILKKIRSGEIKLENDRDKI